MEQLKKVAVPQASPSPPTIRVRLQSGANNSVDVSSSGVEPTQVCSTVEYLAQSSLKATQEIERLHCQNSALFIVCTTLILASLAFALGISAARYLSPLSESSPRHQQYEPN